MLINQARAQVVMREDNVDVLIATSPENVAYIGDYLCVSHYLTPDVQVFGILPADNGVQCGLVIPSLEVDAWAEQPGPIEDVTVYGTFHRHRGEQPLHEPDDRLIYEQTMAKEIEADAVQALVVALKQRGMTDVIIGLDESNLTPSGWGRITEALPRARFVPAARTLRRIRMVKTEAEIDRLTRSAEITEAAITHMFQRAHAGVSERELAYHFKSKVTEMGGDPRFWVVSAGRRSAHVHPRQTEYALKKGDVIKVDVGCTYRFYWSDVGRTKVLGEPSREIVKAYEILAKGIRAAIAQVRPGAPVSTLYTAAVDTIRAAGLPAYDRHHCGHGIGIGVYDLPLVQPAGSVDIFGLGSADPVLESGMVVNLETPYYRLGDFGMIVEDTVVVRSDGAHLLTHLDYSLALAS